MHEYCVTLCRELVGYCIRAIAPDEKSLAIYLNKHYGGLWCRTCREKPPEQVIGNTLICKEDFYRGGA